MPHRRAVAAVAVAVALLGTSHCASRVETPLDRARALVGDASNYDTGDEAGDTLARAATELLAEARRCLADHGQTPSCLSLRSAAAWSNVAAVKALSCRAPGRFTLRQRAVKFYEALAKLPDDADDIAPNPPLPECA